VTHMYLMYMRSYVVVVGVNSVIFRDACIIGLWTLLAPSYLLLQVTHRVWLSVICARMVP
jgi:hypothetical protein